MKSLKELIRPNIYALTPYSSARDEYKGRQASVFLDANENPYDTQLNRYPDPLQTGIKEKISGIRGVSSDRIFLGNGSDEAIDLMYRIFCLPGTDNVVAMEPTYGMYRVCADINDTEYRAIVTDESFQPDIDEMLAHTNEHTKLMFFCSPNNPSGNLIDREKLLKALDTFQGIVIIDEAYIDFADCGSMTGLLSEYPNLVVLQTFSKAWGMAGIRLGMAFASPEIISMMNRVKYPYNINILTQRAALEQLSSPEKVEGWVKEIVSERSRMAESLAKIDICRTIFPSDANFLLVRFDNASEVYDFLSEWGVIVRNRSRITLCGNSLRLTIGTPQENDVLLSCLSEYAEK